MGIRLVAVHLDGADESDLRITGELRVFGCFTNDTYVYTQLCG